MANGIYEVHMDAVSVSGAITLIQIKAGTDSALEILRAWVSQSGSVVSAMQRVALLRKSAAATVTSFTPIKLRGDATSSAVGGTSATGTNASAEGTDGDILLPDAFNVLNGWLYLPVPQEVETVPPGGIIALKFPAAPAAALTITAGIRFREIG